MTPRVLAVLIATLLPFPPDATFNTAGHKAV
jgi:hypothetical protein